MPLYRIHRMKGTLRSQFRWAPHASGATEIKPRDFEPAGDIEATGFYGAWGELRGTERALEIGDVLETETGDLRICKYVGFEEARWLLPEARPAQDAPPPRQVQPGPAHL